MQADDMIVSLSANLGELVGKKLEKKEVLHLSIGKRSDPLMVVEAFASIMKIACRLRTRVEHVLGWQKQRGTCAPLVYQGPIGRSAYQT